MDHHHNFNVSDHRIDYSNNKRTVSGLYDEGFQNDCSPDIHYLNANDFIDASRGISNGQWENHQGLNSLPSPKRAKPLLRSNSFMQGEIGLPSATPRRVSPNGSHALLNSGVGSHDRPKFYNDFIPNDGYIRSEAYDRSISNIPFVTPSGSHYGNAGSGPDFKHTGDASYPKFMSEGLLSNFEGFDESGASHTHNMQRRSSLDNLFDTPLQQSSEATSSREEAVHASSHTSALLPFQNTSSLYPSNNNNNSRLHQSRVFNEGITLPLPTSSSRSSCTTASIPDITRRPQDAPLHEGEKRFKPFHSQKWNEHLAKLRIFKATFGHCLVPHTFQEDQLLARWVKRQRRQYKLMKDGDKKSTMTPDRVQLLNDEGFIWDSHEVVWRERYDQILTYKERHGHCRVPSYCKEIPQLASWVKCQRRQYKLFWEGNRSSMTLERIQSLEEIGFTWEVRPDGGSQKKKKKNSII